MQHGETEAQKDLAVWGGCNHWGRSGLEWSPSCAGAVSSGYDSPLGLWFVSVVEVGQGQLCKGHCTTLGGTHDLVITSGIFRQIYIR